MAGRIRDEDIAAVRERSPIDEVVGEYLQLKNAGGGSLKGLCPFHDEKTPSFNVTPARGLFYCFSCAEGGDVIKFVQKIDGLSFVEAVERLARRAGVELRYEQGGYVPGQEQSQRRRLLDAHRAAAEFYAERLGDPGAEHARKFLAERGFEIKDAERFGVGFSPKSWEDLTRHLRGRGFTDGELIAAGLAREGSRGARDRFRGRLMWPIRDLSGDVIAFGARKLDPDDDGPKYLNTPETSLFRKSTVLYGADLAKREIAQRRQAVIVEGYTDVMACHLAGVPTAVATCGTSFGEDHIKVLRRLIMDTDWSEGEIIFTFDGDMAGRRAALRAFATEERFTTQTYVTVQADGLDPCDLRLEHGDAAVRDLVARRVPLYEFAIRSLLDEFDLDTAEGRIAALDAAADHRADQGRRAAQGICRTSRPMAGTERSRADPPPDSRSPADPTSPAAGSPARHPPVRHAGERQRAPRTVQSSQESPYDLHDPVVQLERQVSSSRCSGLGCADLIRCAGRRGVHRAGAPGGVHADLRLRWHGGRRQQRAGVGRPAARRGAERSGPGLCHQARRRAAGDRRGAGRQIRRPGPGPGQRARGQPADRRRQGPAAAHESGRGTGRIQQDVRRPRRPGDPSAGPAGPGRGQLRRCPGVIIRLLTVLVRSARVTKLGPP